jgi:hypothetical protein
MSIETYQRALLTFRIGSKSMLKKIFRIPLTSDGIFGQNLIFGCMAFALSDVLPIHKTRLGNR